MWAVVIIMITCHSPLKFPYFPETVPLGRNCVYSCCLQSPHLWTCLEFPSTLRCLKKSYSSFPTNLRCLPLQKAFLNWHCLPWALLAAGAYLSIIGLRILWGVIYLLVCLHKGLLGQEPEHIGCYIVVAQSNASWTKMSTELILWGEKSNQQNDSITFSYISYLNNPVLCLLFWLGLKETTYFYSLSFK